jgi:hypothetical protein
MICSVKLWLMKNGKRGTIELVWKCPTSVFVMFAPKPPIRSSTLATFDDAKTVTKTVSPARGVVELSCTKRICGAASGGSMRMVGIAIGMGDGLALDPGVGEAEGNAVGEGAGDGDGAGLGGATPVKPRQATAKRTGRMGAEFAIRRTAPCERESKYGEDSLGYSQRRDRRARRSR